MTAEPNPHEVAQDDGEPDVHPDTLAGDLTASDVELDLAPFTEEEPNGDDDGEE